MISDLEYWYWLTCTDFSLVCHEAWSWGYLTCLRDLLWHCLRAIHEILHSFNNLRPLPLFHLPTLSLSLLIFQHPHTSSFSPPSLSTLTIGGSAVLRHQPLRCLIISAMSGAYPQPCSGINGQGGLTRSEPFRPSGCTPRRHISQSESCCQGDGTFDQLPPFMAPDNSDSCRGRAQPVSEVHVLIGFTWALQPPMSTSLIPVVCGCLRQAYQ